MSGTHREMAWKHPHSADGSVTYTPLEGDVRMFDVDFGYVPEKTVLHNITLYAEPGQKVAFVGATEPAKPPSPILSTVFMILQTVRFVMTASISTKSKKQTCDVLSELFSRIPICSQAR